MGRGSGVDELVREDRSRVLFGVLGLVCGVLLALAVQSSQAVAASWAPAVEVTLPANAASNPHVELGSVSCASSGSCSAVGIYYDKSVHQQVLLLSETGGTWVRGVEASLPANADSNPSICPSGQGGCNYLTSVSCASVGNCSAVGTYRDSSGHLHGLLLSETAGRWAPGVEATLPANAGPAPRPLYVGPLPDVGLGSVSCASAGNCSAAGSYYDTSGHSQGLLLTETGGRWATGVEATLPANAGPDPSAGLDSVSCGSAGSCSAVGTYHDKSGPWQGVLLTETDGMWAPGVEATLPANAPSYHYVSLGSVSCASAGNCIAVGFYSEPFQGGRGLLVSETGGAWAPGVEATLPANAASNPAAALQGVFCASAGNCTAVGGYNDTSNNQHGLLLTDTGGRWSAAEATLPANAGSAPFSGSPAVGLGSVSCASAGNCTALGFYTDSSHNYQPLLLDETGGTWATGIEGIPPANAGPPPVRGSPGGVMVMVSSVSCAPPGGCSAVGDYGDKSGHQQGLLLGALTVLSRLRVSPKTFVVAGRRVSGRCVKQTSRNRTQPSCTRPVKLSVSYQLTLPAQVTITIKRVLPGRLSKRRCVAPTSNNRTHRRCTRLLALRGSLTKSAGPGANSFTFNGRIGGHKLAPGAYQLIATASFGSPQMVTFRIAS